jgi:threonine/homoserine/homoserine lactone efflux protein
LVEFIVIGTVLGLTSGITPGPLLALVLSESLQHGAKAGMKVAVAPILSDIPIIILTLYVLASLSDYHVVLGIISFLGGIFLLFLGIGNFRAKKLVLKHRDAPSRSFSKGVVVNALNPHPYLFWFTIGAPIANKAMGQHPLSLPAFLGCFYASFAGAKIVLATLTGRFRLLISNTSYRYVMRFLGLVLCVLAVIFFRDGLRLLHG